MSARRNEKVRQAPTVEIRFRLNPSFNLSSFSLSHPDLCDSLGRAVPGRATSIEGPLNSRDKGKLAMLIFLVSLKIRHLVPDGPAGLWPWVGVVDSPANSLVRALQQSEQKWLKQWYGFLLENKTPFPLCKGLFRFRPTGKKSAAEYMVSLQRHEDVPDGARLVCLDLADILIFHGKSKTQLTLGDLLKARAELMQMAAFENDAVWQDEETEFPSAGGQIIALNGGISPPSATDEVALKSQFAPSLNLLGDQVNSLSARPGSGNTFGWAREFESGGTITRDVFVAPFDKFSELLPVIQAIRGGANPGSAREFICLQVEVPGSWFSRPEDSQGEWRLMGQTPGAIQVTPGRILRFQADKAIGDREMVSLHDLAEQIPLREVDLSGCDLLTEVGLEQLTDLPANFKVVPPESLSKAKAASADLASANEPSPSHILTKPSLYVLHGLANGAIIPLDGDNFILGRDAACDIVIPLASVNTIHAKILCSNGVYYIEDRHSPTGTFVNNVRISSRTALNNGDFIRLGDFIAIFQTPEAPDPSGDGEAPPPSAPPNADGQNPLRNASKTGGSSMPLSGTPFLPPSAESRYNLEVSNAMPNLADLHLGDLFSPEQLCWMQRLAQSGQRAECVLEDLVQQSWLTAFQAKELAKRRGDSLVVGPYLLLSPLGKGGMGEVFRAWDCNLGREVALKRLRGDLLDRPELVERFRREMVATARLSHPNIVRVYHANEANGMLYIAMELLHGVNLNQYTKECRQLPVPEAVEYVRQACVGMQHAHDRGLVHRDLKPGNIMITPQNVVKVLDLGLARIEAASSGLTTTGLFLGTPDYASPEQMLDASGVDARADVYSLGCTLYYLLAGRTPYEHVEGRFRAMCHAHSEEPPAIERFRVDILPSVAAIVRKMMAKNREERYQTAAEVASDLARVLLW